MKVLVTGASGQLGKDLVHLLEADNHVVIANTREHMDFSQPAQVQKKVMDEKADCVINCAAYTQVDKAESDEENAYVINRDSALAVAKGVAEYGGHLIHVSTDFIFDGKQSSPYKETDPANPVGVYGKSKWEGENAVLEVSQDFAVLRTAWVYGANGNNFVKTILRLVEERDELTIVDDQVGTPSWTKDIAGAIIAMMQANARGIYHYTNEGVCSWYDFALSIQQSANELGLLKSDCAIRPIPSKDYPTPATRPSYSVLSKEKMRIFLQAPIPHWQISLRNMLKELKNA